jgi:DNA-binding PadR family transcriptional regulator
MQKKPQDTAKASRSQSNASRAESSAGSEAVQEYLPDDPVQLIARLKGELSRLVKESPSAGTEENVARSVVTLLKHAHTIAWRGVACGDLDSPGRILRLLQQFQRFVDLHVPNLPPKSRAAVEIRSTLTAFFIAHESLAEVRVKVRLADRERSEAEREVLRVLAASKEAYLRRGQVLDRLRARKQISPARVSQILVQLTSEGLLKRIQAAAQGNPETAYYGLSPLGHETCQELRLLEAQEPEKRTVIKLDELLRNFLSSPVKPERDRITLALLSQVAFSSDMQRFAKIADHGYRIAQTQQTFLLRNCVAASLAATNVIHQHHHGMLKLTSDLTLWDRVPEKLRQRPASRQQPGDNSEPPSTTTPSLPEEELQRLYADVEREVGEFSLLEPFEEAIQSR